MPCSNCHHVRVVETLVYECHQWSPAKGTKRADGTDGEWPTVSLDDGCGQWLHKLYDGFLPARTILPDAPVETPVAAPVETHEPAAEPTVSLEPAIPADA